MDQSKQDLKAMAAQATIIGQGLKYRQEKPTCPGWYFYLSDAGVEEAVKVEDAGDYGVILAGAWKLPLQFVTGGMWAGPIDPELKRFPEQKKEEDPDGN